MENVRSIYILINWLELKGLSRSEINTCSTKPIQKAESLITLGDTGLGGGTPILDLTGMLVITFKE